MLVRSFLPLFVVLLVAGSATSNAAQGASAPPELRAGRGAGRAEIAATAGSNDVVVVESTADFRDWTETLRAHGSFSGVAVAPNGAGAASAFFRASARPRTTADDWKNLVAGDPSEPFQSEAPPPWNPASRWIKFALVLDGTGRVVFQDSARYAFHYDFARVRLPGFGGLSRAEFDAATLRTNGQRAVLGAVVFPPATTVAELGIQFVGLDAYPRERIVEWFERVRSAIQARSDLRLFYLPSFEQAEVARNDRDWLASRGVLVSGAGRWAMGDECYATGWALGRLTWVPGRDIGTAFREGRLRPEDVLFTDAVPAEVPPLAGIVALESATPNSHVAILAQSFGIPFVRPADATLVAQLPGWAAEGREVMVRARAGFGGCELTLAAIDGVIPEDTRKAILDLAKPPRLEVPPIAVAGAVALPANTLRPRDVDRVGGKAANFGVVRRKLPTNSPSPAIALTFDVWTAYLGQPFGPGGTLRSTVAQRLDGFVWPPDMAALQAALGDVRRWITDETDFSATQRAAILEALRQAGFASNAPIRFRSSTNVEDSDEFSGAGLYDSFSGCLGDDLDADAQGPSACDPAEPKERGVFRALRKVFASFYNDNAYLERLRRGVEEDRAGMAVLVHPSTPDVHELANGVATLRVYRDPSSRSMGGNLVTQAGAVSVANPDSAAVPETVTTTLFGASIDVNLQRQSSLVPLGGTVLAWPREYEALVRLLNQVALGYEAEFPSKQQLVLDFEYKKVAPDGRLMVKQVREVPQVPERTYTPWLLNTAADFEVLEGERGDLFAKHRLKSRWRFGARPTRLTDADLATSPFLRFEAEWRDGTNRSVLAAAPSTLPDYSFRRTSTELLERWSEGAGGSRRDFELRFQRVNSTTSAEGPLLVVGDLAPEWSVTYATPRIAWGYLPATGTFGRTTTTNESVTLARVAPVTAASLRQERTWKRGRYEVVTSFWWPPAPTGPTAGYTAPVQAWIETRITGLTSRPLVLRSRWAQTYQPGHHNFTEAFLFEPQSDPEVPEDLLAELRAANVRALLIDAPRDDWSPVEWRVWGLDDSFRAL